MRLGAVLLLALALTATAVLPGMAFAQDGHGEHGGHDEGPANPMVKSVTLFLDASGALSTTAAAAGKVAAGAALPNGESAPTAWATPPATKNTLLDSSVFVELFAVAEQATLVAGGPEGAAFRVQLAVNGEPVEGASSLQKLPSTLLQPGEEFRMKLFLPQAEVALAPGDTLGLVVSFFGLNPEGQPAVSYKVGGEEGSRMVLRLRMASLAELPIPKEVGPWPVAALEGFDFTQAAKKDRAVKEFTLKAFQFGFRGGPLVVPNGTRVVLHLYVDESLSTSAEGHAGHGHGDAGDLAWDATTVTPLHGFSLAALDPRLETVLFDGLVVTMSFEATRPGNYTFLCSVFCGSGHGNMRDVLTVEGPALSPDEQLALAQQQEPASKATPGPGLAALGAGLAAVALAARRRR